MADEVEKKTKRFDSRDFATIAEFVVDEFNKRKDAKTRQDLEKTWKEIDRQLRMEPDVAYKLLPNGTVNPSKAWMPELELPLQSQTLEILTADARRMMSPDSGPWFGANAAMTDKYLDRVDFQAIIAGDENEVPSLINQADADKLVEGWLENFHKQYDFWGNIDLINGEAFKYGIGVGRSKNVTKRVFIDTAKGVTKDTIEMPVLFPVSIKNTYLDENPHSVMNEGQFIGPSTIFHKNVKLADIQISAKKGKNDPKDEAGGWMPKNLKGVESDKEGNVELVEYEGDLIIPRKTTGNIFIPGAIATVLMSAGAPKVIRFRLRKHPFSSYTLFPYHRENVNSPYGSSPLMKGMPIQKAATEALNRLVGAAILNNEPPISYDASDPHFVQGGGPQIFPSALWATIGDLKPHQIGQMGGLQVMYAALLTQYADVTGVNAPRLGAQTKSHTTATSKELELSRGVVRTVDYVKSTLSGAMQEWLDKEFIMGKDSMSSRTDLIEIPAYRGFVEISKKHLPDVATFDVFGSGGPAEQQAQALQRFNAMQQAIQIEITKRQAGIGGREMDLDNVQEEILREGGWVDTTPFFKQEEPVAPTLEAPGGQLPGLLTGEVVG